jgi:hypothetical protein
VKLEENPEVARLVIALHRAAEARDEAHARLEEVVQVRDVLVREAVAAGVPLETVRRAARLSYQRVWQIRQEADIE